MQRNRDVWKKLQKKLHFYRQNKDEFICTSNFKNLTQIALDIPEYLSSMRYCGTSSDTQVSTVFPDGSRQPHWFRLQITNSALYRHMLKSFPRPSNNVESWGKKAGIIYIGFQMQFICWRLSCGCTDEWIGECWAPYWLFLVHMDHSWWVKGQEPKVKVNHLDHDLFWEHHIHFCGICFYFNNA